MPRAFDTTARPLAVKHAQQRKKASNLVKIFAHDTDRLENAFRLRLFFRPPPHLQGTTILPGERTRALERFTPLDNSKVVFVKLADGRGWIPVKSDSRGPSTVLQGW